VVILNVKGENMKVELIDEGLAIVPETEIETDLLGILGSNLIVETEVCGDCGKVSALYIIEDD